MDTKSTSTDELWINKLSIEKESKGWSDNQIHRKMEIPSSTIQGPSSPLAKEDDLATERQQPMVHIHYSHSLTWRPSPRALHKPTKLAIEIVLTEATEQFK